MLLLGLLGASLTAGDSQLNYALRLLFTSSEHLLCVGDQASFTEWLHWIPRECNGAADNMAGATFVAAT